MTEARGWELQSSPEPLIFDRHLHQDSIFQSSSAWYKIAMYCIIVESVVLSRPQLGYALYVK
jgi:hypothetical protein